MEDRRSTPRTGDCGCAICILTGRPSVASHTTCSIPRGAGYVEPDLGAKLVNPSGSPALEPLSERERDIIHLLALGYTNQEIGQKLFISVRTVDTHRAHIMRKLQLETRAELVMYALANGVIGPSAE